MVVQNSGGIATVSFEQTVERRYVHRWALSEVFLTDLQELSENEYVAAAHIPTSHAYYGDHLGDPSVVDTMLLMECARQAATCLAHRFLGVPFGSAFLVATWSLELAGRDWPRTGERPGRLMLPTVVVARQERGGVLRGAAFVVRLVLDGRPVGTVSIDARYTPADEADLVRRYRRRNAPPLSTGLPAVPPGQPVPSAAVGRHDPANVLLFDPVREGRRTRATLGTRPGHPSLYDHPQDHYTAMILMEGARQLALLATEQGAGPGYEPGRVGAYRSRFTHFAELDAPLVAEGTPGAARERTGGWLDVAVPVRFQQNGAVVSEVTATVSYRRRSS